MMHYNACDDHHTNTIHHASIDATLLSNETQQLYGCCSVQYIATTIFHGPEPHRNE